MQWYNSKTQELQSVSPWGASYIAQEVMKELYGDWQQVTDDFLPQTSSMTTEQKLAAIDAEYEAQFTELSRAWATANMDENSAVVDEIKDEYKKLQEEYKTKREAVTNVG